jgi:hypothetical protein
MDKTKLTGYMEFASVLSDHRLDSELKNLVTAAYETQIHTFGWPIAPVIYGNNFDPKPIQDGIRVVINDVADNAFDYWTLKKNGEFYILKSLFEDRRGGSKIFVDTRVIRSAEVFLRTARLYKYLGVPIDKKMACQIEYGGLQNRVLAAANPNRFFPIQRKCSVNVVKKDFEQSIGYFLEPEGLKEVVFETVRSITEMCDFFVPQKDEFVGHIIDEYLRGRIG